LVGFICGCAAAAAAAAAATYSCWGTQMQLPTTTNCGAGCVAAAAPLLWAVELGRLDVCKRYFCTPPTQQISVRSERVHD
jgi:hypothetical protein